MPHRLLFAEHHLYILEVLDLREEEVFCRSDSIDRGRR
jgi:hypothetical protein